jgi:hypothetical protein
MWYPGAHVSDGILANVGLNVHFSRSLGGTTNVGADKVPTAAGAPPSYDTMFQELDLGLRGRIPMGAWEIGLNLGWGKQAVGLDDDNAIVRLPYSDSDEAYPGVIPDIDMQYYRFGADVGFKTFDWSWVLGAGIRTPFYSSKPGQIANERWFPNAIGTTATANIGLNIPLFSQLGLAINADFRQTGMDMNTTPNAVVVVDEADPSKNLLKNSVAGGATDRHILVMAGLTWSFGQASTGVSSGADTSDDEAPAETGGDAESSSDEELESTADSSDASDDADETPAPTPPAAKDTSNPSFFGAGAKSAPSPQPAPQPSKDTSNPGFFK